MDAFQFQCGACEKILEIDRELPTDRARCPFCRKVVHLPSREPGPEAGEVLVPDGDPEKAPREVRKSPRRRGTTVRPAPPRPRRRFWIGLGVALPLTAILVALGLVFGWPGRGGGPAERGGDAGGEPKAAEETKRDAGRWRVYRIPDDLAELALVMDLPKPLLRSDGKRVPPDRWKMLEVLEAQARRQASAKFQAREADPFFDAVQQVQTSILGREGLDRFEFRVKWEHPYVIFEHVGKKERFWEQEPNIDAKRRGESKLRMLQREFAMMKRRWMDPFGLTMDPNLPLVVISLQNREAYVQLHRAMGDFPFAVAYYHRIHTYIVLYNEAFGKDSEKTQAGNDGIVFHEGCHQIVNAFVNKGRGYNSLGLIELPFWVSEGLAEYMGSVRVTEEKDEDGFDVHEIGVPNPMRLKEFWRARHPPAKWGVPPYFLDLWDLIECFNRSDILDRVQKKVGEALKGEPEDGLKWRRVRGAAVSMVYAEASCFFLFCYTQEGGKYGKAMDRYLRSVYEGKHYTRDFMQAFGDPDLKELNREWLAYIDSVTPESVKKKSGK
ncbi:MAG: RING finger protein [Planctomycetota bacterium]|jgi:hypothetical protein